MALQVTTQPNSDPLNLQGGNSTVPAVPSVQPPAGVGQIQPAANTGNVLQPAAPAPANPYLPAAKQTPATPPQTPTTAATIAGAKIPANTSGQTFTLGNGKTYDQGGNEIDANGNIASGAGMAGISASDFLNLLGSETATNAATNQQIQNNLGIPQTITAAFAPPQQTTVDFYNQAYNAAGLGDLKQKIADYDQQIADTNQQYINAAGTENENPFLSEAARVGRVQNLYNTAQETIANLTNEQANYQNLYAQGVNEVNNAVTRYTNDFTENQSINQQKLTALLQQAETQEGAAQNTTTEQLIQRYYPQYASAYAQSQAAEKPFGTAQTGLFTYNPTTKTYSQVSPPAGQYSPITTPTGGVIGFNTNTGGATNTGVNTYTGATTGGTTPGTFTGNPLVQPTSTLSQLLGTYVNGPSSNQPAGYESGVVSTLQGMGVNANSQTTVSQLAQNIPQLAQAIATNEGYGQQNNVGTSINNPGNIEWAAAQQYGLQQQFGATAYQAPNGKTYAAFPTQQAGMQALQSYLGGIMGVNQQTNNNVGGPAGGGNATLTVAGAPADQGNISGVTDLVQAFSNLSPQFSSPQQLALSSATFQGYLQSGNISAASNFINTLAYKNMQPATQSRVDNVNEAIDAYTQALTILNKHPELSTGEYQNIVQSAKPWAGTNPTQDYTQFNQLMNVGNSLLENGLYGIRLNPTDISQSASFQPSQGDPTATVVNKLKGAIGFFNYANAQTYSQQTGVQGPDLTMFLQQSGYQQ